MKKTTSIAASIALLLAISTSVFAQSAPDNGDASALRVATGKRGKGYSKLFADIRSVCGNQVNLVEVETEGGLQNLTTLAANQADLGFAQIDTLQDMQSSDEGIGKLQAVTPLNMNLLHILSRNDPFAVLGPRRFGGMVAGEVTNIPVAKFSDLKGLPVAVVGSARALGRVLDRRYGMGLQFVDVETDEQGLAKLRSGEVAGMLSTAGWPSGPVQKLKRDAGLRLLPFDLAVQPPYQLMRKNYENLDTFNHGFLASPNLMVTRPFSANGPNGRAVASLQACIQKNLVRLQEGQYEPAWPEVKNISDTFGWPRFAGSQKR